jgi:DNA repair exonuclease SbcCD ATPase subunit
MSLSATSQITSDSCFTAVEMRAIAHALAKGKEVEARYNVALRRVELLEAQVQIYEPALAQCNARNLKLNEDLNKIEEKYTRAKRNRLLWVGVGAVGGLVLYHVVIR